MSETLSRLMALVITVVVMEILATLIHRYVMHGVGWAWHQSHHRRHEDHLERNDLFSVIFAGISGALFAAGTWVPILWWVGLGMVVYGLLYFVVHDGIVHGRLPFRYLPRSGYLKRLVQAHRLHHASAGRDGCVSFGFLYAPSMAELRRELRGKGAVRR